MSSSENGDPGLAKSPCSPVRCPGTVAREEVPAESTLIACFDVLEVDENRYVAIITDGKGVIPNGTKILVPNQKLKWDAGNPTGHGIIFIGMNGQV
jgi:hypothetical protein